MRAVVTSSADVARYGRMDASFHVALATVQDRVAELEASADAEAVAALLSELRLEDLFVVAPLLRGQQSSQHRGDLLKAVKDYPFIAYALVQAQLANSIQAAQASLAEQQAYLLKLQSLQKGP